MIKKVFFLLIGVGLFIIFWFFQKHEAPNQNIQSCKRAGCSGHLCVNTSFNDNLATTCEWSEKYACYQKAKCEIQENGKCGFTQDDQLKKCLDKLNSVEKPKTSP